MAGETLMVEFIGERIELQHQDRLTFGRVADLQLDTNQDLPSVVGAFEQEGGLWWIRNERSSIDLRVLDVESHSSLLVAPGTSAPVPYRRSVVRLDAGRASYEIALDCGEAHQRPVAASPATGWRTTTTLNREQRQLLAAMAEPFLSGERMPDPPSNAAVARRLDWSLTKLNRKLDHLCIKFDKLGVQGLRGNQQRLAVDRRRRLIEHCVATELVVRSDLDALPPAIDLR